MLEKELLGPGPGKKYCEKDGIARREEKISGKK